MLDLCVAADSDVLSDRFLQVNQQLLDLWETNGRAAFFTTDWQTAEAEADALRSLIPADQRREMMDQVGDFFYLGGSGEIRETAVMEVGR